MASGPDDLTALTARELARRVREGLCTAEEVATAHLRRVADHDGTVGAFQAVDAERVLAEAAGVDARADRFALPLAGVPVAIKDNVDVSGYPTRHGSAATSTAPALRDDELVRRLRAAGAVVVGKTRMPELAIWGVTHSALGVTRNPLDLALDPGGSSGGSAAAVAAGMAALGLGTDGGGSVRIPAASCGLAGLKPGAGVLPLPGGAAEHWFGLSVTGPLARTADDAALMYAVLAGADTDAVLPPPDLTRVAVSVRTPVPVGRVHPDHRRAATGAAALLAADGAEVVATDPPYPALLAAQWSRRWHAGVARDVADLGLDRRAVERRTAAVARKGRRVLRFGGPQAGVAARWRERALAWFDRRGLDVLLTPALAAPPLQAGALSGRGYLRSFLASAVQVPFTPPWNLAGLPAAVVPVRVADHPVGVQLVGRPGSELRLLAVAATLEHRAVPVSHPGTRTRQFTPE